MFYRISNNIIRGSSEKQNVNLFIIPAPFDLLLSIQSRINSKQFELSKNLGKSSVTQILLAEEQTTKKSKYIKHWWNEESRKHILAKNLPVVNSRSKIYEKCF